MAPVLRFAPALAALLALGCATPETVTRRSALADYLGRPAAAEPVATGPVDLRLPLRLGILFVPGAETRATGGTATGGTATAVDEAELHRRVAERFGEKPWTLSFKVIPALYLGRGGGFEDLDRVARSFGVEVVALVSVDQLQASRPRWYAWTYWTVVGAYMVKGDRNDTTTFVDAAVFHVPSRTFLFRAGGAGTTHGGSTWAGREGALREQSRESLTLAMAELSTSLDKGVEAFKRDLARGARPEIVLRDAAGRPLGSPGYDPAAR